tara:strand:+ start:389 stop:820 length:432 start_codon:yes stop_codon:yes gene_type:complete
MLLNLNQYIVEDIIADDPVRPHIKAKWRLDNGREVFGLYEDESFETLRSVICVAYTDDIPIDETAMDIIGTSTAVFYTVWSYDRGAGRDIVFAAANYIKHNHKSVGRYVTLSPLTKMAERFHTKNGAKLIAKHNTCQNFEYKV